MLEILSDGLNWVRIVVLYVFVGVFVVECCKEGCNFYVLEIGNWMYEFVVFYMVDWIKSKGGWVRLRYFMFVKWLFSKYNEVWCFLKCYVDVFYYSCFF